MSIAFRPVFVFAAPAMALVLSASPALAERPMSVDDAGTLEQGGAKLEFGWGRDDRVREFDVAAGFAPLPNLELEVGLARGRDHESSPDTRLQGVGFAAKWVPLQAETGLSAGVKVEHARARADDRVGSRVTARGNAVSLLASWRFASEQVIHFNAGREWVRVQGDTEAANTWGLGFEQPLTERLQLVAEVFGAEESRPDRQIGLRYEIMDGLKVSAAVGRGSDRSIANAGISWEF